MSFRRPVCSGSVGRSPINSSAHRTLQRFADEQVKYKHNCRSKTQSAWIFHCDLQLFSSILVVSQALAYANKLYVTIVVMDCLTTKNGDEIVQKLPATDDEFGGVVVEMKEHMDSDVFRTLLKTSMSQWKLQGKKGVWIKLPIDLSNLVDAAVKEGFWYHHAEPKYLMLLYWIPKTINPIPGNASHIARVGAIVLNDKREMLVVQEKMGILRGVWKISTGIIHEGEDISEGLVREVKEETGIDAEFVEVLAFSQEHNVFFGKSELLFLCMMRPVSFEIQIQETEIEAAQWMPLEEYAAQLSVQEQGLRKYITELCIAKAERAYSGFSPFPVTTDSNGNTSYIYFNKQDINKEL